MYLPLAKGQSPGWRYVQPKDLAILEFSQYEQLVRISFLPTLEYYLNRIFKYDMPGSITSLPTVSTYVSPAAPAATRSGVKC